MYVPGVKKRQERGLDETNLDQESILQLRLAKRYGHCGALVIRLVGMLSYDGHHIIGDNAFSSVQLASDLKVRKVPNDLVEIPKCD